MKTVKFFLLTLLSLFVVLSCSSSEKETSETQDVKTSVDEENETKDKKFTSDDPFYSSKKLDKIYLRQAKRMNRIIAFKKKGNVGEADNGLLRIRTMMGLKKKESLLLKKLVKVENSDREIIFKSIEKGIVVTPAAKKTIRFNYFENQMAGELTGFYYFRADHWHKK